MNVRICLLKSISVFLYITLIYGCVSDVSTQNQVLPENPDYKVINICLKRDTIKPSKDILIFKTIIYNDSLRKAFKQKDYRNIYLETDFTEGKVNVLVSQLSDSIFEIRYPTNYYYFYDLDSVDDRMHYEFFFQNQLLRKDTLSY